MITYSLTVIYPDGSARMIYADYKTEEEAERAARGFECAGTVIERA